MDGWMDGGWLEAGWRLAGLCCAALRCSWGNPGLEIIGPRQDSPIASGTCLVRSVILCAGEKHFQASSLFGTVHRGGLQDGGGGSAWTGHHPQKCCEMQNDIIHHHHCGCENLRWVYITLIPLSHRFPWYLGPRRGIYNYFMYVIPFLLSLLLPLRLAMGR